MKKIQNVIFCPWVEAMIRPERWKEIKTKAKFITEELLPNGLTRYEILDDQQRVIDSFVD